MLFNSSLFIVVFLPITVLGFYLIGALGRPLAMIAWLVTASLVFYGWWNPAYLALILASMVGNYLFGLSLAHNPRRAVLAVGVAANLGLLGYFKYANFFVDNLNAALGTGFNVGEILLPLAISFFTFQQIAYLVDTWQGHSREYRFLHYALFVTFFPQLIAGPIVHHREMLPQFERLGRYPLLASNLAVGIAIFSMGLFKKVVIADGMALYATPVFEAAEAGVALTVLESWMGALAYSLQIYFDFSGYSDMAIGLARLFGLRLPINFNSPYQATSIIDFWRRWHMTLSRFLRDYLYIPLGGNRKGSARRHVNLMLTMLLGGLWHGAGWTFVLWGGLHGLYLVINHGWRRVFRDREAPWFGGFAGWALTAFAVVIAWVPFRAESLQSTLAMYSSMFGMNGWRVGGTVAEWSDPLKGWLPPGLSSTVAELSGNALYANPLLGPVVVVVLVIAAAILPNTIQVMRLYRPALLPSRSSLAALRIRWLYFRPNLVTGVLISAVLLFALHEILVSSYAEFIYWSF